MINLASSVHCLSLVCLQKVINHDSVANGHTFAVPYRPKYMKISIALDSSQPYDYPLPRAANMEHCVVLRQLEITHGM